MRIKPTPEDPSKQWDKKIYKSLKFTFSQDDRVKETKLKNGKTKKAPLSNRFTFIAIYILGLLISLGSLLNIMFLGAGLIIQLLAWSFSIKTSKSVLETRDKIYLRMAENKKAYLGNTDNPNDFVITEWENFTVPKKIEMAVPPTKDQLAVTSFLGNFNAVFGSDSPWVPDTMHPQHPGYDMNAGIFTMIAIEPLPLLAPWNANYVLNENIAWNFFPIALGSQGGVPLEMDGKTVRVLGFATGGEQQKMVQKRGLPVTPDLAYAPQILIAGPTGGGKALAVDTLIPTITTD